LLPCFVNRHASVQHSYHAPQGPTYLDIIAPQDVSIELASCAAKFQPSVRKLGQTIDCFWCKRIISENEDRPDSDSVDQQLRDACLVLRGACFAGTQLEHQLAYEHGVVNCLSCLLRPPTCAVQAAAAQAQSKAPTQGLQRGPEGLCAGAAGGGVSARQ
jgi:hypothetical protein